MPSEEQSEIPGREANLGGFPSAVHFSMGQGEKRPRRLIHPDPGLFWPAWMSSLGRVEMEPGADRLVIVARGASIAG